MSHLTGETLARLVDEQPSALEAAHLADCADCRTGLEGMRADVQALGGLGEITPPAHAWPTLEERLAAEGLVRGTRRGSPTWLRIAAALALFLTGTLAGFAWRTATLPAAPTVAAAPDAERADGPPSAVHERTPAAAADQQAVMAAASAGEAPAVQETPAALVVQEPAATASEPVRNEPRITGPAPGDVRFASMSEVTPRTAQEAAMQLRDAEGMYLDALARYAQLAGNAQETGDPLARLAALEGIVLTTREALGRAPADPIINGYHMTALAQREATLRQIAATTRNPWF